MEKFTDAEHLQLKLIHFGLTLISQEKLEEEARHCIHNRNAQLLVALHEDGR